MNIKAGCGIAGVFIGCCSNVIFLELLIKHDPGSGNLITFSHFLFISLEGLIFTSNFGRVKPIISLKDYSKLVLMFFVTSVCNNYAFNFNIPMPLHMIFRAGSLMANMIMGILILRKRYPLSKYLAVVLITVGIVMCTLISATEMEDDKMSTPMENLSTAQSALPLIFWWSIGIGMLTLALLISAYMGIYQEVLFKKYGKHSREALFYTHLLPLPVFLLMFSNIQQHLSLCTTSPTFILWDYNSHIPEQIVYLIFNVLTQYVCISSVYVLTSECTSLTVTLVVTLRKFVSLIFSIFYFNNKFTIYHTLGTFLVFAGTFLFMDIFTKPRLTLRKLQTETKYKSK